MSSGPRRRRARRLERRLFGWLFAAALLPSLAILLAVVWIGSSALQATGTLGPWESVAESSRTLFERIDARGDDVPADIRRAADRHRDDVSASLLLARRWSFLGDRAAAALPVLVLGLVILLALLALAASRRIARGLTRPIQELVGWAEALGREEPLPPARPAERRDVREVAVLRTALRQAAADRAAARRRALEAERTRAWGEMARRVAHEMKNPLTPLRLAAHRLGGLAARSPELNEPVDVIEEETGRLETLAAQFSELGRPPEGPASDVDLTELLESVLASDVPPDVVVRARISGVIEVEAHYEPLLRAFRNIVRNAIEAMGDVPAPDRQLDVDLSLQSGSAVVVVADRGPGMEDADAARIFEPDFTTKSHGTGLGLTLARQTVRAAGGEITVSNRAGGGAAFRICIPARAAAAGRES